MLPGRDSDVFGFYGAYGHFSSAQRRAQEAAGQPGQVYEMVLEVNYRINLLPWFYLQPGHPGDHQSRRRGQDRRRACARDAVRRSV
jgi:hypothetical protein